MTPKMQKKRDEFAEKYDDYEVWADRSLAKHSYKAGFNAAHDLMLEEMKPLVEFAEKIDEYESLIAERDGLTRYNTVNLDGKSIGDVLADFKERFGNE